MNSGEPDRVRRHSPPRANRRIDDRIAESIHRHARAAPEELNARIAALDREWDMERTLQTNAATLALAGVILAFLRGRRWLLLSGGVLGFLLLHGARGWCPPVPLLRRLGVRTAGEIDRERFALKFLRGDFADATSRRPGHVAGLVRAVSD
ncbi:MAG TPA: hypothetical protein VEB66_01335 [Opitutaceae bacterium]|nr:hypothetical protein [Opitutaceae bacterium]